MVSNKDITWIHAQIQDRYGNALGLEKSILGEVLGLFESAPEFQIVLTGNDISDEELRQLLEGMRHECVILPGGQEASIELLETAVEIPDCKKCAFNDGLAYWHQCEGCLGEATNNFVSISEVNREKTEP